jgi:thiosulfate reductase cytochrome b subunit
MSRIYLYKRYERFWHWSQAALIIVMMITGFEVHGTYQWLGFGKAVQIHTLAAWSLLVVWAFTIFWQFTTGEWRQYIPTLKKVTEVVRFYAIGIFTGAHHPFHKTVTAKHNPLQRLAYLAFLAVMGPFIWGSGILYLFYGKWEALGLTPYLDLAWVAFFHTVGAFMILSFFFAHVYMTTTGETWYAHIKSMITGWEEEEH